jgi:hypothetical protein
MYRSYLVEKPVIRSEITGSANLRKSGLKMGVKRVFFKEFFWVISRKKMTVL